MVYFCASAVRGSRDAFAREPGGGTCHRTTSTRLSWTRTLDSIGLGRVFTPNGDAMVEGACRLPGALGVAVEVASQARIGSPLSRRAHDPSVALPVQPHAEVVWGLSRSSDVFDAHPTSSIARGARSAPRRPSPCSSRRASSRPPSTPGLDRPVEHRHQLSSPERVRPGPRRLDSSHRSRSIRGDRRASFALAGPPRATPGRDTSCNAANRTYLFLTPFFPRRAAPKAPPHRRQSRP